MASFLTVVLVYPPVELYFPLLSVKEIPSSLFCAEIGIYPKGQDPNSFSDAHLFLLNTLRIAGQLMFHMPSDTLAREIVHSRDALQQGIEKAVVSLNLTALDLFLKIDHVLHRYDRPYMYYVLPSKYFRLAAEACILLDLRLQSVSPDADLTPMGVPSEKLDIRHVALISFCFLLTSSAESLPYDDPMVKAFAELVGGEFGKWLQDCIAELPRHIEKMKSEDDAIFIERGTSYSSPLAGRYDRDFCPYMT